MYGFEHGSGLYLLFLKIRFVSQNIPYLVIPDNSLPYQGKTQYTQTTVIQ